MKPEPHTTDTKVEQERIRKQLAKIYTPSAPIKDPELFSGREELLERLRNELVVPGKVFILYGERGVGKTSFYSVLLHERKFERYSCTERDTFPTIFLNILRALGEHFTETEISNLEEAGYEIGGEKIIKATATAKASVGEKFAPILPEVLDQASIIRRLKRVQDSVDAIVFDEFQLLEDPDIHAQMNDLVKALSDEEVKVRIIFVGIAESDEQLLPPSKAYVEYKMRHYVAVKIPRMTETEIKDIFTRRKNLFNIFFLPEVTTEIARIASGYPSFAHTLALNSCSAWLTSNAIKFVGGWVVKLVAAFLGNKEVKVEKINLEVGEQEFARGVVMFLRTFHSSYEEETKQFRTGLTSTSLEHFQRILLSLADCEDGIHSGELAKSVSISEDELLKMISLYPSLVVQDEKTNNCRLGFSHLRTVIRAYDYLRRKRPAEFSNLVTSGTALAKTSPA